MNVYDHRDKLLRQKQYDNLEKTLEDAEVELARPEVGRVSIRKRKKGNQASDLQKQSHKHH